MKTLPANSRHKALVDALLRSLTRDFGDLPAEEILAVTCQIVGRMVALQDRRRFTPAAIMELVSTNIQEGNREIVGHLASAPGGRA